MASKDSRSIAFFDAQFARQSAARDYTLNPFEVRALPRLAGSRRVLDLGCGLGNLALAVAGTGARVTALDASPHAIEDLRRRAAGSRLDVDARQADLAAWRASETYDAVACIGLLMFFARDRALAGLLAVRDAVAPGGLAVVNVLAEGTTFLDMFDPAGWHLFTREELLAPFAGWHVEALAEDDFPAPGGTLKRFLTLVARRPA